MPRLVDVNRWFRSYDNPMKEVVEAIRSVVLAVDPRIDECIKWQAPTFTLGPNLASFYPKNRTHASLMFHEGAKIPGKHPRRIVLPRGLLMSTPVRNVGLTSKSLPI